MEVVIMPAYKPDERMVTFAKELKENGINALIVDDGSGEEYKSVFEKAEEYATVIHHETNKGKGAALRYGISKIKEIFPECTHFTTADSDGQHRTEDVLKLMQDPYKDSDMVLTEREFKDDMPLTSWMGNTTSRWVFTILTGRYYGDNQSGLRRFSIDQADWLLNVKGNKYDYELDMLYYAEKQHIKVDTMAIPSIYIDGNKSSHFDPLRDTLRIYKRLFSSAGASLIAGIFAVISVLMCTLYAGRFVWPGVFAAGIISSIICGILNKLIFFKKVKYRDFGMGILRVSLRYAVYALLSAVVYYLIPKFPIFAAYIIMIILSIPVRFILKRWRYNKTK